MIVLWSFIPHRLIFLIEALVYRYIHRCIRVEFARPRARANFELIKVLEKHAIASRVQFVRAPVDGNASPLVSVRSPRVSKGYFGNWPSLTVGLLTRSRALWQNPER